MLIFLCDDNASERAYIKSLVLGWAERQETVQIIFITGYPDFIAEGYEVEALHYLLKPVMPEKLGEVLSRAAEKISRAEKKRFWTVRVTIDMSKLYLTKTACFSLSTWKTRTSGF